MKLEILNCDGYMVLRL